MAAKRILTDEERIEHARLAKRKWAEKQKAKKQKLVGETQVQLTEPVETKPIEKISEQPTIDYSNYVAKAQFEALQHSFELKCREYDQLLNAYRAMALRYTRDGEAAKQFIKAAMTGISILFPDDEKGEH